MFKLGFAVTKFLLEIGYWHGGKKIIFSKMVQSGGSKSQKVLFNVRNPNPVSLSRNYGWK